MVTELTRDQAGRVQDGRGVFFERARDGQPRHLPGTDCTVSKVAVASIDGLRQAKELSYSLFGRKDKKYVELLFDHGAHGCDPNQTKIKDGAGGEWAEDNAGHAYYDAALQST